MGTAENQLYLTIIFLSIGMVVIFLVLMMLLLHLQQRRFNHQRNIYQREVELLSLEQHRISVDIHDEIGSTIHLAFRQVEAALEKRGDSETLLTAARENLTDAYMRISQITANMVDEHIGNIGLKQSIKQLVSRYQQLYQFDIHYTYCSEVELTEIQTIQLYRMVQELLHNTFLHSQGTTVKIKVLTLNRELLMWYEDDGMPSQKVRKPDGRGLLNLERRAVLLGGRCSREGKKYSYLIKIPLKNDHDRPTRFTNRSHQNYRC